MGFSDLVQNMDNADFGLFDMPNSPVRLTWRISGSADNGRLKKVPGKTRKVRQTCLQTVLETTEAKVQSKGCKPWLADEGNKNTTLNIG